nr:hypothetical protein BaRGS_018592 [Batillaria attramentaria]
MLRKLVKRARREQQKFQKTYNTLDLLDKERSTWQLVRSLFKDRLETEATIEAGQMDEEDMLTDIDQKLVVDWLENCAREDLEQVQDNVKFFTDQPVVWENTMHQLQSRKKGIAAMNERPLVDQLGKYDQFETAIYAALSGNLKSLLPVCHSWYDCLWAYFRTLVDVRVEQERIQAECQQWYHVIQKFIVLGDIPSLVEVMYSWVRSPEGRANIPQHLLRFLAHLVLFLRRIGQEGKEELCTVILEAYVERLIQSGQKRLVAHYVSTLPPPLQIQWYAHFLEGVKVQEEREMCLQLAEDAGLDIATITKTVVENIRNRDAAIVSMDMSLTVNVAISEEDRQKIEAIDWLVFDPSQRAEALKQANAVMRSFIVVKKHSAAREVYDKLPSDTINVIYQTWHAKTTKDRMFNVLLFTDGGWMVDRHEDPEDEESRPKQMALLRRLHIPALCLNLHHVLHASGLYAESVQLADTIASEYHQLYKEFNKDDLQQLLRQIRESSLNLLNEGKDPLGYDLV